MLAAVAPSVSFVPWAAASARRAVRGAHVARLANRWSSGVWAMRLAVSITAWIGLATSLAMALGARADAEMPVGLLAVRALGGLSWVNGTLVAWALAGELRRSEASRGVGDLITMRGYTADALVWGRSLSAAARIALLTGVPAVMLCLLALALAPSLASAPWLVLLLVAALAYACILGGAVALLVYLASAITPRHARLLLAAVVFGPSLANQVVYHIPTVPGLFAWLLRGLSAIGVMA